MDPVLEKTRIHPVLEKNRMDPVLEKNRMDHPGFFMRGSFLESVFFFIVLD